MLISISEFVIVRCRVVIRPAVLVISAILCCLTRMLRVSLAYFAAVSIIFLITLSAVSGKKAAKDVEKPTWAKKDIRDYSDADMERLLDQWDVGYLLKLLKMILILIFVFFFNFFYIGR